MESRVTTTLVASRQVDAVPMHAARAEMMIVTSKMITDLGHIKWLSIFCEWAFSTFEDTRRHHDRIHRGRWSQPDSRNCAREKFLLSFCTCRREKVFVCWVNKLKRDPKDSLIAFKRHTIGFTSNVLGADENNYGARWYWRVLIGFPWGACSDLFQAILTSKERGDTIGS